MNVVQIGSQKVRILVVTAHGKQELIYSPGDRIIDCLQKNDVSWSGVAIYKLASDGKLLFHPSLDSPIESISGCKELHVYYNRNINPFLFKLSELNIVEAENTSDTNPLASEYIYQDINSKSNVVKNYLKKLSQEECQDVISARVHNFIEKYLQPGTSIVLGTSGGGDSNSLLHGLMTFKKFKINVIPMIIKGIYDWDMGVPRAQALCDKYGLNLTVVPESEVKSLLNFDQKKDFVAQFEKIFPGDDFEFFGTLLIRLALIKKAEELSVKYICTGLNLEDVLCESLYRICNNLTPAPFPVRELNGVTLIYPLWECPKRIIDGCFPKFSLDNYEARYPCFSVGRNLYYQMAYTLQSQFPGAIEKFLYGLQTISSQHRPNYRLDENFNFLIERLPSQELRKKFLELIG